MGQLGFVGWGQNDDAMQNSEGRVDADQRMRRMTEVETLEGGASGGGQEREAAAGKKNTNQKMMEKAEAKSGTVNCY